MPVSGLARTAGIFQPEELELLQRVFEKVCRQRGLSPDGMDADFLAMKIVGAFKSGIVGESSLIDAVASDPASSSDPD